MNKSIIALGVLLIIIGVIMFVLGQDKYEEAQLNYQYVQATSVLFGGNVDSARATMNFWGGFTSIGFIMFILGIPIGIVGAVVGEKKDIILQKPMINRYCPKCGQVIPFNAVICPFCKHDFEEKNINEKKIGFCPKCGAELEGTPYFCFKCGYKLR